MERNVRCQGAIVQNDKILLVKHLNLRLGTIYWWLPGGGPEASETFESCMVREVREETNLSVRIEQRLPDYVDTSRRFIYERYVTYLCTPISGEMVAGDEAGSLTHSILGLGWYPLWDESAWETGFYEAHIFGLLKMIQEELKKDIR